MTKKFNYLQGDPALFLTNQGANIIFKGGAPVMDQGIQNAALISLFTKKGWWANLLTNEPSKQIGSDFQEQGKKPIVDILSINNIEQSADRALKWMKDTGFAGTIGVTAFNPNAQQTVVDALIQPVGQDAQELRVSSHGLNWQAQANFPAEDRK